VFATPAAKVLAFERPVLRFAGFAIRVFKRDPTVVHGNN